MATEQSLIGSFTTRISANFLCVVKLKMAARFAEPTETEIIALLEKATPENTKKQLYMEYIIKQLFHSLSS